MQLGPISLTPNSSHLTFTSIMSKVGMPSVIQTISSTPASAASRMDCLPNVAGTNIKLSVAHVEPTASITVSKTGKSKWS